MVIDSLESIRCKEENVLWGKLIEEDHFGG